jgi:hypothetical protein|tara:strand:- start:565 stop:1278 length:714 start_codon:yes stop_codon:yes gene_type:complete
VSISRKLKWLKLIDTYRHFHTQLDYSKELGKAAASEFQCHYEDFCVRHDIDLAALNRDNQEKLKKVYEVPLVAPREPEESQQPPSPGALALFEGQLSTEPSPVDWTKEEKEIHDIFSRLLKKIAVVIHPDKLSKELPESERIRLTKLFQHVILSLEKRKYFVLLEVAEQLEIDLPKNYMQQIRWLKKEIEIVRTQNDSEQRTYNYMFGEAESDEERDRIIRQFIQQLFGIVIPAAIV